MKKQFVIRSALPADAAGIAIVSAYTWLTAYSGLLSDEVLEKRISSIPAHTERLIENISAAKRNYAVAEYCGAVIGFVCFGASRDENYPDDGEIQALYVLKGFQGMGIGRMLVSHCINAFAGENRKNMIINCLDGNSSAGFYSRIGGVVAGQRTDTLVTGHVITENIFRFTI